MAAVPIDDLWLLALALSLLHRERNRGGEREGERRRENVRAREAQRGEQEDVRGAGHLSFPLPALEHIALLQ